MSTRTASLILSFAIALGGVTKAQMLDEPNTSGGVVGSVVTVDDRPVSDAKVELRSSLGQVVQTVYSNPRGDFAFSHVSDGQYQLEATAGASVTTEALDVHQVGAPVTLRMPFSATAKQQERQASGPVVSVGQLKVPEKAVSFMQKAREALGSGKLDRASEFIGKALDVYPHYADALTLRGILELTAHRLEQASADVQQAIDSDPNYAMAYIAMATIFNSQSKFEDALRVIDRGITLAPTAWQGYFEKSRAYLSAGKFPEALAQVRKASQLLQRDEPNLHLVTAYSYIGMKDYSNATPELEKYLSGDPSGPNSQQARLALAQIRSHTHAATAIP